MSVQIRIGSPDAIQIIATELRKMNEGQKLPVVALSDKPISQEDVQGLMNLIADGNLAANRILDKIQLSYTKTGDNQVKFDIPVGSPLQEYDRIIEVASPCFDYYYQQIPEKDIYNYLLTELCKGYSPIYFPFSLKFHESRCADILGAISNDHPELWFLSFNQAWSKTIAGEYVRALNINYIEQIGRAKIASMDVQFRAKAKDIIVSAQRLENLYEREICIYDRLCKTGNQQESEHCNNAYGAIVQGCALANGYAAAFKFLADRVGLQAMIINGDKFTWNIIKVNGHFYNVQLIQGILIKDSYALFNVDDAHMRDYNRSIATTFELPTCERMDEFYYNKTGQWIKGPLNSVAQQMAESVALQTKSGNNKFVFCIDQFAGIRPGDIPNTDSIMNVVKNAINKHINFKSMQFQMSEMILTITVQ